MSAKNKRSSGNNSTLSTIRFNYERENKLLWLIVLTGIAVLFVATAPASAGEQYMAGSPVLSASLAGEPMNFHPVMRSGSQLLLKTAD